MEVSAWIGDYFTFTMSQKQQKEMSLETKLKILNEIDSGKLKKGELSINYGIAKSTISIIWKNRGSMLSEPIWTLSLKDVMCKKWRFKLAFLRWIKEARSENLTFTDVKDDVQENAKFFAW